MPFSDHADRMLRTLEGTLGEPATIRLDGHPPLAVTVLFSDEATRTLSGEDGLPQTVITAPEATLRASALPPGLEPRQEDRLRVRGCDYLIADVLPDGQAGWRLPLRLAD